MAELITPEILDGMVKVTGIFYTAALLALTDTSLSENLPECNAGREVAGKLAWFEFMSFAFSDVAYSVSNFNMVSSDTLFYVFCVTSVPGVLFLTLAVIYGIRMRIVLLSCGNHDALAALSRHAIRVASGFLIGYLYFCQLVPFLENFLRS